MEGPQCVRPDGLLDVRGRVDSIEPLVHEDVEVVEPELGHHLAKLVVGERRAHQGRLREAAEGLAQLARLG